MLLDRLLPTQPDRRVMSPFPLRRRHHVEEEEDDDDDVRESVAVNRQVSLWQNFFHL